MKIESGWEVQPLGRVPSGSLIYLDAKFCIVTNVKRTIDCTRACVDLESGYLLYNPDEYLVEVVDEAVLKIGGYYK